MNNSNLLSGQMIEILEMKGEPEYTGKRGMIEYIDDIGQLHGTWGGLAINAEFDKWRIISSF